MVDKQHHEETHQELDASPDSIPVPANPETRQEKTELTSIEEKHDLEKKQTNKSDIPEPEYPPMVKVIPVVAALYMAMFLVALVCYPYACPAQNSD